MYLLYLYSTLLVIIQGLIAIATNQCIKIYSYEFYKNYHQPKFMKRMQKTNVTASHTYDACKYWDLETLLWPVPD